MIVALWALRSRMGSEVDAIELTVVAGPWRSPGGWWGYVQIRAGDLPIRPAVQEIGLPFEGFIGAFRLWVEQPGIDMVMGVTYLALAVLMVIGRFVTERCSRCPQPASGCSRCC